VKALVDCDKNAIESAGVAVVGPPEIYDWFAVICCWKLKLKCTYRQYTSFKSKICSQALENVTKSCPMSSNLAIPVGESCCGLKVFHGVAVTKTKTSRNMYGKTRVLGRVCIEPYILLLIFFRFQWSFSKWGKVCMPKNTVKNEWKINSIFLKF